MDYTDAGERGRPERMNPKYLAWSFCVAVLAWSPGTALAASPRPNVVVVFIDTLRADRVHCYGYPRETTPSLDSLAREGTRFDVAMAQAPWSLPSYSTIFSSLYPPSHGVVRTTQALNSSVQTLAEIMRSFGYHTAAMVSGGHLAPEFRLTRGFDTYQATRHLGSLYHTVPQALDWIDRQQDAPFFLVLHGYDCHGPYNPPFGFGELYDPGYEGVVDSPGFLRVEILENIQNLAYDACALQAFETTSLQPAGLQRRRRLLLPPLAPELADLPGMNLPAPLVELPAGGAPSVAALANTGRLPFKPLERRQRLSQADVAHIGAHYDGGVTYADTWLGLFVQSLARKGLLDRTVLVVCGDHGEELGERGRFGHGGSLYDTFVRVPFVWRGPGIAGGRVIPDAVGLIDLAPTLLELCGIPPAHQHQGRSLRRYLRPETPPPAPEPEQAAFSFENYLVGIRTSRWHMVGYQDQDRGTLSKYELFDVQKDPAECLNLSLVYPEVVRDLSGRLQDLAEKLVNRSVPGAAGLNRTQRLFLNTLGYW